jgi:hypothetical protein
MIGTRIERMNNKSSNVDARFSSQDPQQPPQKRLLGVNQKNYPNLSVFIRVDPRPNSDPGVYNHD